MKLKVALVTAALLLAAFVGIIIVASNDPSNSTAASDCPPFLSCPPDPPPSAGADLTYVGTFKRIPASVAFALNLVEGVEVATIDDIDPIAEAGLHAASGRRTVNGVSYPTGGDVITAVDGRKIRFPWQLSKLEDAKRSGDTVSIRYYRDGRSHTVQVKLG
jgi:S1-C subfamily serine protease